MAEFKCVCCSKVVSVPYYSGIPPDKVCDRCYKKPDVVNFSDYDEPQGISYEPSFPGYP